jgi:hypothetical protein
MQIEPMSFLPVTFVSDRRRHHAAVEVVRSHRCDRRAREMVMAVADYPRHYLHAYDTYRRF